MFVVVINIEVKRMSEIINVEDIPETRQKGIKKRLFAQFSDLPHNKALKVKLADYPITMSGFRYIVVTWNKTHKKKDKLEYRTTDSRNPEKTIAYVSFVNKPETE